MNSPTASALNPIRFIGRLVLRPDNPAASGGGNDPLYILGIEEIPGRDPSLQRHHEAIRILLIASQREAELEEFRRDGVEPGCGNIVAIFGDGCFVSSTLISLQSVIQRALLSQALVNRRGQEICITKGVANSLGHHRVFVAASIAYECPARSERTAQEVGQVGGTIEPFFAASRAYSFRESGNQIHSAHELAFDICFHRTKFGDGPSDKNREQIVVG